MSRRYSKKVYVHEVSQYVLQSSITFVYDGWNMIRKLDARNGSAVIRSHVWGLDLSGTLQGAGLPAKAQRATAGGVGGLLGTLASDSSLLTACYDANGNIGEYVASDGAIAAHYEYDPFGNTTASSGASAGSMPVNLEIVPHMQENIDKARKLIRNGRCCGRDESRLPANVPGGSVKCPKEE